MDMKRIIRRQLSLAKHADLENDGVSRVVERRSGLNMLRSKGVFVGCLMALPLLVTFFVVYRNPLVGLYLVSDRVHEDGKEELVFGGRSVSEERGQKLGFVFSGAAGGRDLEGEEEKGLGDGFSLNGNVVEDKLLGGLLTTGFDEESCLSRYQSAFYRKTSKHKPSSYLLGRLRKYEALHKQCGPGTEPYNKMVSQLKSGDSSGTTDCQYVVWISNSGLGNRVLTIASAFLYALLTNRVILVDRGADMGDLFCEPFTEKSWLLPLDFPLNQFNSLDRESPKRYGHMLKNNIINYNENHNSNGLLQKFVYLHLSHDYDEHDKLFFCDNEQQILQKIPFLLLRSDNYFVPSLFLIPMFEQELSSMFPEKASVFHHLGRYLFHPSNSVWGLITRFYQAYLANAEERIGIQIRTFDTGTGPFQHVYDQILACTRNEKLLPEISLQESIPSQSTTKRSSKAVLITSLSAGYFEKIRNMFWEHPTVSGDIISVYQPSHEGFQQTENQFHNMKAWAEMYLLSLSDVLITSSWSTFGYVAQSLGGLKPWILFKPENHTAPDPPCRRAMSMEPCFHAPPFYDCKAKTGIDTGNLVPHVKHCEDMSWGLKLVDHGLVKASEAIVKRRGERGSSCCMPCQLSFTSILEDHR